MDGTKILQGPEYSRTCAWLRDIFLVYKNCWIAWVWKCWDISKSEGKSVLFILFLENSYWIPFHWFLLGKRLGIEKIISLQKIFARGGGVSFILPFHLRRRKKVFFFNRMLLMKMLCQRLRRGWYPPRVAPLSLYAWYWRRCKNYIKWLSQVSASQMANTRLQRFRLDNISPLKGGNHQ